MFFVRMFRIRGLGPWAPLCSLGPKHFFFVLLPTMSRQGGLTSGWNSGGRTVLDAGGRAWLAAAAHFQPEPLLLSMEIQVEVVHAPTKGLPRPPSSLLGPWAHLGS